jgi:hypothetical protein
LSTILKALRRIEEEKADGLERPLREDVVLAPAPRRRVNPSVLIAVAAVAFAATLALLTLVHDREAARAVAGAAAAAASAVPAVSAPTPAEVQAPQAPPAAAEVVRPPAPVPTLRATSTAEEAEPDVLLVNPDARGRSRIAVVSEREPAASAPIAAMPSPKRTPAAPAASLRVLRTSWHPRPEKRTAWVQAPGAATAQAVHEGDRIGGFVVREIEPAAVVLSDGTSEIRRSVGSR